LGTGWRARIPSSWGRSCVRSTRARIGSTLSRRRARDCQRRGKRNDQR
jgi:hypothetical protein